MTTARDDVATGPGRAPTGERSAVPALRGLPWWICLLLSLVFTAAGTTVDIVRENTVGVGFTAAFAVGAILAILLVRRSELFGPMVSPPLVVAVVVPAVIAASGSLPSAGGFAATALAIGAPLITAFPAMAITTAACLALGWARVALQPWQRPDPRAARTARRSAADGKRPERPERSERSERAERSTERIAGERAGGERPAGERPPRERPSGDRHAVPDPGRTEPRGAPRVEPRSAADLRRAGRSPEGRSPEGHRAPIPGERQDARETDRIEVAPDEPPARRSPLVLPPEDDESARRTRPVRPEDPRRRSREERMRAERMRDERRREDRRRDPRPTDEPPRPR